ncbi:hypothetical protein GF361_00970 [Candidatus Woesearchaeota archaeon]|nr:hypothetical protein [Candidatus Woesearchaeota archaeon]
MIQEKTHNNIYKFLLFTAVSLVLVSTLLLFQDSGITGHFSADFRSQILDMEVKESQTYSISTNSLDPIYITSLRLTGNIIGYGGVEIYIEDQGEKFLIYQNIKEKETGLTSITGMAVAEAAEPEGNEAEEKLLLIEPLEQIKWENRLSLSENQEFAMGLFSNKCKDTCYIEMPVSSKDRYKLVFMIEPGTIVNINKIIYTLKEDMIE